MPVNTHSSTIGNLIIQDIFPHFPKQHSTFNIFMHKLALQCFNQIMKNFGLSSFHSDDAFCVLLPEVKAMVFNCLPDEAIKRFILLMQNGLDDPMCELRTLYVTVNNDFRDECGVGFVFVRSVTEYV